MLYDLCGEAGQRREKRRQEVQLKGEISLTGRTLFGKTPKDSKGYHTVGCGSELTSLRKFKNLLID